MRTFSLGAGKDTVVFAANAAANGEDEITGFTAGAGGDVLDLSNFAAAAGVLQKADSTTGYLTLDNDGNSIGIFYNDTDGTISSSNVKNSSSNAGDIIVGDGKKAVVLVTTGDAGTTASNTYNVYYVTGTNSGGTTELVGTVTTDNVVLTLDNFA